MGAPAIALDHDLRPVDQEVDLVAADPLVKGDGREPEPPHQPFERRLEDAVGRLAIDLPLLERLAERGDTGPSLPRVDDHGVQEGVGSCHPRGDHVPHGSRYPLGLQCTEVAQGAQDVGGRDAVAQHWRQVLVIARPVDRRSRNRWPPLPIGEHHVDAHGLRTRDAPQERGGAV